MKGAVALVGAVIAITGIAWFATRDGDRTGSDQESPTYAITGTFRRAYPGWAHGMLKLDHCLDLETESVAVLNGAGDELAIGSTVPPVEVQTVAVDGYTAEAEACVVDFIVDGVPRASLYRIDVADVRGPSYTFQQLDALDFGIEIQQIDSFEDV